MFAEAYKLASEFTFPVVISSLRFDGKVTCGIGSCVILNDEGWFLSAAHILDTHKQHQMHLQEIQDYERQREEIESSTTYSDKYKQNRIKRIPSNPQWLKRCSYWWGRNDLSTPSQVLVTGDLMVGKFHPFDPSSVRSFPIIKNPSNLEPGTSVCKLGYPFHVAEAEYDEISNSFRLKEGTLPIPRFPIEGMFTRTIDTTELYRDGSTFKWIETSSPGLRGQSGGPIFDKQGTVWGIQSHTNSLALGFEPIVKRDGRDVVESQFLNVGVGIHPEVIVNVLIDMNVKFVMSDY